MRRLFTVFGWLAPLVIACGARTELPVGAQEDGGGGGGSDTQVPCVPGTITLEKATPAVMFVLDRSRSMDETFSGGATRWETLRSALDATLPEADTTMDVGALFYPAGDAGDQGMGSCEVSPSPTVPISPNNVSSVLAELSTTSPRGATPTSDALESAGKAVADYRTAHTARTIVIATDGAPDCNEALSPATCTCVGGNGCSEATRCLDDDRTVETIANIAASGIPVFVIGILGGNDSTFVDVLDRMADAGGQPTTGEHRFYAATSSEELKQAFAVIRDRVGSCVYLTSSVPGTGGTIRIYIDGVEVPYDASGAAGWSWVDASNGEIVFAEDACVALSTIDVGVTADVTCGEGEGGTGGAGGAGRAGGMAGAEGGG